MTHQPQLSSTALEEVRGAHVSRHVPVICGALLARGQRELLRQPFPVFACRVHKLPCIGEGGLSCFFLLGSPVVGYLGGSTAVQCLSHPFGHWLCFCAYVCYVVCALLC